MNRENPFRSPTESLPIAHLNAYGFQRETIECWAESGLADLTALQSRAVMETGLLRGENVIVLAPTSAGKTFVGELAAVRHWQAGRKTIFLSPTRALVAEQYRHLKARYEPLGIRVVMATADHTRHDGAIRRGDFDFAVMVYEKMRAFLVTCPQMIYSTGAVVADELQILADPQRGETADLLLTRMARAEQAVQIIGLSAVIHQGELLARWLDAELLECAARPTSLREGILCREHGVFHYFTDNNQRAVDEELPGYRREGAVRENCRDNPFEFLTEICAALVRAGENCLIFVPTRPISRQIAASVAAEIGRSDSAPAVVQELQLAEDSLARRQLLECLPCGVAFHNSDLTTDLRAIVETSFNSGDIRVIVATPTLAQGVNLRAQNVIQLPLMLRGDGSASGAPPAHVPLSVERYRNQAGRAGRLGGGAEIGRSILPATDCMEAQRLSRAYIQAQPEPIHRSFTNHSMDCFVLDAVNSSLADSYSAIHAALAHTFAWHSGAVAADSKLEDQLAESIRGLLDMRLLDESSGHRLRLTGSGQAMSAGGFQACTIREMMACSEAWDGRAPTEFEILCACAFTADGELFTLSASPAEIKNNVWPRAARELLESSHDGGSANLNSLLCPPGGLSRAGHSALKMAVIASAWISEKSTADIENEFRVIAGVVSALASHLAWLGGGLAACAAATQSRENVIKAIAHACDRLPQGLAPNARRLGRLEVPGLSRHFLNLLAKEGFDSVQALRNTSETVLRNILPPYLAERLLHRLREIPTRDNDSASAIPSTPTPLPLPAPPQPDALQNESLRNAFAAAPNDVDLMLDSSDPGGVIFYGNNLRLPPKPYALLCLLAQRCGATVSYTTIDEIVWPDEKVEPQQISAHKSKLIRELGAAAGKERAEAAILTDPRYGLRLAMNPAKIALKKSTRPCAA